MTAQTQKLSIRLLRAGLTPEHALRRGVDLKDWAKIAGAKIALNTMGGSAPRWAEFLDLTAVEKERLKNSTAYGLVFVQTRRRWFAVTFGMGHVKLDSAAFEQDFGLRVVLNAVDPKQLKSADIRTPDENTLSRRSQTSRGSDQTAFNIDIERDIVRGLAGTPKQAAFASRVAGSDALSMDRKTTASDLATVCADAYAMYQKTDYRSDFAWIDQIRHVRDDDKIEELDIKLVDALDRAVKGNQVDELHLAFPVIYDPATASQLRYRGFRSQKQYGDLDLAGYLDALQECGKAGYSMHDLKHHSVHEVDDQGGDCGGQWDVYDCLVFETSLNGHLYVLSGGRWYQIDSGLAHEVREFFNRTPRFQMPAAQANENEQWYNARVAGLGGQFLCLDRKLIKPTGAPSSIEVCDFISLQQHLVHVKDKTSSSRLSHLFNQGTVSALALKMDGALRDGVRTRISEAEAERGQAGYLALLPSSTQEFRADDFTVVYAVLAAGAKERLPFFSLVSFRQAARELQALGYRYAFAWIRKPRAKAAKKRK